MEILLLSCLLLCSQIAKAGKWPRGPPTDEWMKKIWHLDTTKFFFSVVKRNVILPSTEKWVELEKAGLKKARLRRTDATCFLSYVVSRIEKCKHGIRA